MRAAATVGALALAPLLGTRADEELTSADEILQWPTRRRRRGRTSRGRCPSTSRTSRRATRTSRSVSAYRSRRRTTPSIAFPMASKVAFVVLVVVPGPTASIYPRKRLPRPLRRRLRDVPVAREGRARELALVVREEFQGRDRARVLVGHDEADDACVEYGRVSAGRASAAWKRHR